MKPWEAQFNLGINDEARNGGCFNNLPLWQKSINMSELDGGLSSAAIGLIRKLCEKASCLMIKLKKSMFYKMKIGATISVALSFWSTGVAAESTYSCWFPALCIAPDGECRQSSLKVEFSLSDVVTEKRIDGRSMFGFPDFSVIYIQEDSDPNQECFPNPCLQSQYVRFYEQAYQAEEKTTAPSKIPRGNIETGYGVCQVRVEQKKDTL